MDQRQLSEVVLKSECNFRTLAQNASSNVEKVSFLKCAEASARLAPKVKKLESKFSDQRLFGEIMFLPEHEELIKERNFRYEHQKANS